MSIEVLTILLGIIISIIFYEITNISPCGVLVPGLLVMFVKQPERMIFTLIVAIITYYLIKLLSKYVILFGFRRQAIIIITSLVISFILEFVLQAFTINLVNISIVGYSVAGLIANEIYKQGIKVTVPALVIVTCILELVVLLINQVVVI